jgi:hypothetical protein
LNWQVQRETQTFAASAGVRGLPAFVSWKLFFVHIVKVVNLGPADNIKNLRMVVSIWCDEQPSAMQDTAKLASPTP